MEGVLINYIIDAPREWVWEAWTQPGRVKQWWGPRTFTTPISEIDLRVGGRYFNCMRSPEGKQYCSVGVFQVVNPPERLVMTDSFADEQGNVVPATYYGMSPATPQEMTIRVSFQEEDGKTRLTLHLLGLAEDKDRDNARLGWTESFQKLAAYLDRKRTFTLTAPTGTIAIEVQRIFNAPQEEMFRAYTDPRILERWWGSEDLSTVVEKMEVRPGGLWRVVQRDRSGNQVAAFHGVYHEAVAPWRLINTFEYEGLPGRVLLETVTFEDRKGATLMTDQMVYQSVQDRDTILQSGLQEMAAATLDRLDAYLSESRKMKGPKSDTDFVARAKVSIHASAERVWDALTSTEMIRRYMFGAQVISDWKEGSSIIWKGEWQGRPYEDRGVILQMDPERILRYSHYSPLSGLPDIPDNRHQVTIELEEDGEFTQVILSQDHNTTEEDQKHAQKNWEMMLDRLKQLLENDPVQRLFSGYERAFAALDTIKTAEFFSDIFISAGPRGAIAQSKAEFLKMAYQAAEFYRRVGQTSAKILSMQEIPISDQYSMAHVRWSVTFQKTGDRGIEFDVSYLVQKTGPEPQILLFIAHQDEEAAMQELGVLPEGEGPAGGETGS
jgi:uncharacterized protein YndB with AHSA1/START domain